VEIFFSDRFELFVDTPYIWTSYMKGERMESFIEEEEERNREANPFFHCEIQTCSG